MNLDLLKKLTSTPGVAGREEKIRKIVMAELETLADEVRTDSLGNLIALCKGRPLPGRQGRTPKVMLAAHMDEIGFIVHYVDKDGFLKFVPSGGFDPRTLISQRITVHTAGKDIRGVIGVKPVHVMEDEDFKKAPKIKDLVIDIGYSKKEAEKLVLFGDPVTLDRELVEFGSDMITSKALDNRAGVYAILEALKRVKKHDCDVYAVASVQEEVGLRGAIVSSFAIEPDIGVAVDTTAACDIPFCDEHEYVTRAGGGIAITIRDGTAIGNVGLVKFMKTLAEKEKIRHQMKIAIRGGNDAGAIQRSRAGVPVVTLSIPTRYIHSSVEALSKRDLDACVSLVSSFIRNAHRYKRDE